jgi:hypothetical protein
MDYAIGEKSELSSTCQRLKDLKDSGKTQRRSADLTESSYFSMKKIQDNSLRDLNRHMQIEFVPTL